MSAEHSEASVILVSAPNEETAVLLARMLLEESLIACANLIPQVRSLYRWEGKICDEAEVLLVLKAPKARFEEIRQRVVALHPYSVPEVLQLAVTAGHDAYLQWLLA